MVAIWLSAMHPEIEFKFFNKGINGDGIRDLSNRWQKDTLNLKPDVVSILIGINDVLGKYFLGRPTLLSDFENTYRNILQETRDKLNCKIILMEPFSLIVSNNVEKVQENLTAKIEIIWKLSVEFKTFLVPLNKIFNEAVKKRDPQFWSQDGFHPTQIGHALIAQSWLETWHNLPIN